MSDQQQGYKRINFFKGFLTTEKDWNDAERYHIDKRALHNKMMHAPGVVAGFAGELRVTARARGDLSVEIQPGYAIDGQGHDLHLWDAVIKHVDPGEFRLPQTIYIVLRYFEELTDFIAYKENLEYKGHRRVLETCKVEISQTEPDVNREVELARIYLEKGATRIRDARDPDDPRANEIDLRFVPQGGIAGSPFAPHLRLRLQNLLMQIRRGATEYARRDVVSAHDVIQAANSALMLMACGLVDQKSSLEVFSIIIEAQAELALDVDVHHPTIAAKKEFSEYRRHIEILKGLLGEAKPTLDVHNNLVTYQAKATEIAIAAVAGEKPTIEAPQEKKDEPRAATLADWEGVKTLPNPKPTMDLEGTTWVLVDEIEILNKESEEKHAFAIKDAKDSYRSRQKLKYPDGTVLEDTGRAQVGGYTEFKLLGITPNRPIVLLRRMDYVYGDYEIELLVNGKSAGMVSCAGVDRVHRWRNWPAMIPAELVTENTVTIRQVASTAGRDVNMFHLWIYQPK
ncbi:MAG: hypothetical protein R2939_19025 [Kofleriaceae bacterium]